MSTTATSAPIPTPDSPKKALMPRRQAALMPLDYSFMGLTSLSEMQQHDPVSGIKKSLSAGSWTTRANGDGDDLISSTNVDISSKMDVATDDMHEALRAVFDYPVKLQWLDLSGNQVASIPSESFSAYPELFTLHLHGNRLSKYSDIDALAKWLPRLHALTLHGNPLEDKKHYRNYVIAAFPNLKQLNFSSVTPGDRDKAETWAKIYKNARNSGKIRHDEL